MSKGRFVRGTAFTLVSNVISLVIGLGTSVILARVLGPEKRGIYTLATLLPSLVVTFGNFGIGPATVFFVARGEFSRKEILGNNILMSFIFGTLGIGAGIIIIAFFRQSLFPGVSPLYLYFILAIIPVELFATYTRYILLGAQSIRKYNYIELAQTFIFLVLISIALLTIDTGVTGALTCFALTLSIMSAIAFVWAKAEAGGVDFIINRTYMKKAVTFGLQIHLANILGFLNYRIDMLFISAMLGPSAVGLYTISVALVEKLWLVSYAASTVLFPRVSAERDEKRSNAFTPLVARTVLWTTAFVAIALLFLSRFIIFVLYSNAYLPAASALKALLVGTVSLSAGRVLSNDIAGRGRPGLNIYIGLATVATNVILNWIWIPRFGITGAAWASTASYTIAFLGALIFHCKLAGNKWYTILLPQKGDIAVYIVAIKGLLYPVKTIFTGRIRSKKRGNKMS